MWEADSAGTQGGQNCGTIPSTSAIAHGVARRPIMFASSRCITLVLVSLLVTATGPAIAGKAQMALPEDLRDGQIVEVSKRKRLLLPKRTVDDVLVFGEYRVMAYRQGWNHSTTQGVGSGRLGVYRTKDWAKFEFVLHGPDGAEIAMQCAKTAEEEGLRYQRGDSETRVGPVLAQNLDCDIEADGSAWQLALAFDRGDLRGPGESRYAVSFTNAVAGRSFRVPTPSGFVFSRDAGSVAAVDLFGGRFVFAPELAASQRDLLAAAGAALMLAEHQ